MRNREDKKCKKGQESIIGKIIYGFLLFMPLLAIGVTCLYAIFNKNAYQSFRTTTDVVKSITTVDNNTLLVENNTYYIDNKEFREQTENQYNIGYNFIIENSNYNLKQIFNTNSDLDIIGIWYRSYNTYTIFGARFSDNTTTSFNTNNINNLTTLQKEFINSKLQFEFIEIAPNIPNTSINIDYSLTCLKLITFNTPLLNDVFYYAVDKVEQSTLFNWAENSIIYTTTHNTCIALNITNTFIPLLLSYWLIISVIYFLYDIALMLVWIIHRKIHEMQESI